MVILSLSVTISISYTPTKKLQKTILVIFNLLIIISGFLLLHRFGIKLTNGPPTWVWLKLLISLFLTVVPLFIYKKLPSLARNLNFLYITLVLFATFLGIFKP